MEEGVPEPVNFISCARWIRKGVAKSWPIKIELTEEELADLVKSTNQKLTLQEAGNNKEGNSNENVSKTSMEDEYDMANYDNAAEPKLNIGDIAVYDDEYAYQMKEYPPDSDDEDDIIKPDDNLIAVGHMEGFGSSLDIYVYNQSEDSLYVHHDILLPSEPLCVEWLNYDPEDVNRSANLCAVGCMTPIIEVWDLDFMNCIRPLFCLGKKPSKKRGTPRIGHRDAVLDISWNTNLTHIAASGSADKKVLLWDLENQTPHTKITSFTEKVQTLQWHPFEAQLLLGGSSDRTVKAFDCQSPDTFKCWKLEGEVERVLWNRYIPNQFLCSDGNGFLYCFDYRQENLLWKVSAHTKEITGLTLSSQCPGFLATASQDGTFKVWDILGPQPELISEKNLKIGGILCLENAPDDPFLMVSGGDKKSMNMFVFNAIDDEAVQARFKSRELVPPVKIEGTRPSTSEAAEEAAAAGEEAAAAGEEAAAAAGEEAAGAAAAAVFPVKKKDKKPKENEKKKKEGRRRN